MPSTSGPNQATKAFVITGPTSGIGYRTVLELAQHGTVVLVGRDATKLANVEQEQRRQLEHALRPDPSVRSPSPRRSSHTCPRNSVRPTDRR